MRGIFSLLLVFVAGFAMAQDGMATFEKENISIKYPETWALSEGLMGSVFVLQSPMENDQDRFSETVSLMKQDLSYAGRDVSVKEFAEVAQVQLKNMVQGFSMESSEPVQFAGQEAYELVYSGKQEDFELKWKQIVVVKDKVAYMLSYQAAKDAYDRQLENADKVLNSFNIK